MSEQYIEVTREKHNGMPYPQSGIPVDSVVPVWILAGSYADAYEGQQLSYFFSEYAAYELFKRSGSWDVEGL